MSAGYVVMLADGREGLVTTRVETEGVGPFDALLQVALAPETASGTFTDFDNLKAMR